jgi:hypothetical protein
MSAIAHYDCPNCGAHVDVPETLFSTKCAFCDSPVVKMDQQEVASLDILIPFLLNQKDASQRLNKFISSKYFTPKEVKMRSKPDQIKGVFIPFWVYQAKSKSNYSAKVGIYWYETVTYTTTENGKTVVKTRQERRTEWHSIAGSHVHEYVDHLVCGSKGITEEETNAIEPFDLGKALKFSPDLLAGRLAESPTLDKNEAEPVAHQEILTNEGILIKSFLPGDTTSNISYQTEVDIKSVSSALLPIWIATYKYKDEVIRLLVNGQTGKVNGDVPTDWKKIIILASICIVIILIIAFVGNSNL